MILISEEIDLTTVSNPSCPRIIRITGYMRSFGSDDQVSRKYSLKDENGIRETYANNWYPEGDWVYVEHDVEFRPGP